MASWLKDRYPTEITVVMQHWYDDLEVKDDGFSVTLNFGDTPEHLVIPYEAILTFVDPSVEFGLRFETNEEDEDTDEQKPTVSKESNKDNTKKETGQVVSLDNFRKRKFKIRCLPMYVNKTQKKVTYPKRPSR